MLLPVLKDGFAFVKEEQCVMDLSFPAGPTVLIGGRQKKQRTVCLVCLQGQQTSRGGRPKKKKDWFACRSKPSSRLGDRRQQTIRTVCLQGQQSPKLKARRQKKKKKWSRVSACCECEVRKDMCQQGLEGKLSLCQHGKHGPELQAVAQLRLRMQAGAQLRLRMQAVAQLRLSMISSSGDSRTGMHGRLRLSGIETL